MAGTKTDILRRLLQNKQSSCIFNCMNNDVVSISIFTNNQRVKLTPDSEGKFLIPNSKGSSTRPLIKVTAVELVSHPQIKHMDPVITLGDGSKLRIFQGGDPTAVITLSISLLEKHDKKHTKKIPVCSKSKKTVKILTLPFNNTYVDQNDYDDDDYDYPWDDPSLYDDAD